MVQINVVPPPQADIPRIKSTTQNQTLNRAFNIDGVSHANMGSLNADFARLEGAIARLNYVSCRGTITVAIRNGSLNISGELTTYAEMLADQIEQILNCIDRMGKAISKAYSGAFSVRFTFRQAMEYNYKD